MKGLDVPKGGECLLEGAEHWYGEEGILIAIIEDSDDQLCFIVGDHIAWDIENLLCVLLW